MALLPNQGGITTFTVPVAAGGINTAFTIIILLVMAVLQVFVQMGYWMHLKDKGHLMPILFMIGGFFVASTCIVMALFWVWWY